MVVTQSPTHYLAELLLKKWTEAKQKNPRFSLRSFSKRLSLHSATLSLILKGKRRVSHEMARELASRALATPEEIQKLDRLFTESQINLGSLAEVRPLASAQLAYTHYNLLSDWVPYALLSLMETSDFESNAEWMARRLGLTRIRVQKSLDELLDAGLAQLDANQTYRPTFQNIDTTTDVVDLSIRQRHATNLELAREALFNVPVEERYFGSATIAIDMALLPQAKNLLREFERKLAAFLESGAKNEVYEFQMQLVPRTQVRPLDHQTQIQKGIEHEKSL